MSTRLRTFLQVQAGIVLFTTAPILAILVASAIASLFGCRADEGSRHACVVAGVDIGGALTTLLVSGWLLFVTLPVGATLWLGHIVYGCVHWLRRSEQMLP